MIPSSKVKKEFTTIIKNPINWDTTSNFQLEKWCLDLDLYKKGGFIGAFSKDHIRKGFKVNKKTSYIINLDDSDGGGTHWTAYYYKNGGHFFFDSYGLPPPKNIVNKKKVIYSTNTIQKLPNSCGLLCVIWLYLMTYSNKSFYSIILDMSHNLNRKNIIDY